MIWLTPKQTPCFLYPKVTLKMTKHNKAFCTFTFRKFHYAISHCLHLLKKFKKWSFLIKLNKDRVCRTFIPFQPELAYSSESPFGNCLLVALPTMACQGQALVYFVFVQWRGFKFHKIDTIPLQWNAFDGERKNDGDHSKSAAKRLHLYRVLLPRPADYATVGKTDLGGHDDRH